MPQADTARVVTNLMNQAAAQRQAGQLSEALATYVAALGSAPNNVHLLNGQAGVLGQMGRFEEAATVFDAAIALAPRTAELHFNRAFALQSAERWVDALSGYDRALYLKPDYPEALNNRGLVLQALKRPDDALADFNQALDLMPNYARALHNRGVTLQELNRFDEAMADYDRALELDPNYAEAHYNRGGALGEMERFDEALASFQKATQLSPRYGQAHLNEGLVHLLTGDFARGWPKYEWRDGGTYSPTNRFSEPNWRPTADSAGKTVYLYGEQGFGDTIQFARYAKLVADRGATVMLGVPAALKALLGGLDSAPHLFGDEEFIPPFDYQRPLLSLPFVFGTTLETIPAPQSYLTARPERIESWKARLGEEKQLRIGICWQGSPDTKVDAGRSIPLAAFAPLARTTNVRLISLQKVNGLEQLYELPDGMAVETLSDLDSGPDAFVDTAAVMMHCDLIITSDTAIAHLAGALGRPTWVALKRVPDFRWLLRGDTSPWYPTMRLFRQETRGDWTSVFAAMAAALEPLAAKGHAS
jgi:tetratricopeptide (TPR) repeat protein